MVTSGSLVPVAAQLRDCRGFHLVPGAKLLVHEEQPAIVAEHTLAFLRRES